ncbi:MAG TPA: hypothetical protein VNZ57_03985, partial [Longimicrobiales bacterium]|nr:hypothetical protein [Longimicrobiales bacterium]
MNRDGTRKKIRRIAALGALVLHALVAVALPYADATGAPTFSSVAHITEPGTSTTSSAHDH